MNKRNYVKTFLCCVLALVLLSGCSAVRPVSGEAGSGAGRDAVLEKKNSARDITVCIDAGHGFDDVGTSSSYLGDTTEKDITLAISLHIKRALEKAGYTVLMTHNGETFPKTSADDVNNLFNPQERVAYANTRDIDYFISVHCDSYMADASVSGTRVYCCKGTKYAKESLGAARCIADSVTAAYPDAKQALVREMSENEAYYVIRETNVPSSLIELGFVTNRTDAANMLDDAWRQGIAAAIADGIDRFFTE